MIPFYKSLETRWWHAGFESSSWYFSKFKGWTEQDQQFWRQDHAHANFMDETIYCVQHFGSFLDGIPVGERGEYIVAFIAWAKETASVSDLKGLKPARVIDSDARKIHEAIRVLEKVIDDTAFFQLMMKYLNELHSELENHHFYKIPRTKYYKDTKSSLRMALKDAVSNFELNATERSIRELLSRLPTFEKALP